MKPVSPPPGGKSPTRSIRNDIDSLATNVAEIKAMCVGLSERLNSGEFITPVALEVSTTNIILSERYSVVDVARIAAGCAGVTSRDRVLAALQLLEAAEAIASPNPWEDQPSEAPENTEGEDRVSRSLRDTAWTLVHQCTTPTGIHRRDLLEKVYQFLGRTGGSNAQSKAYKAWAESAANEWAEIRAWRDYVSKKPGKETPAGCDAWRKAWKGRGGSRHVKGFLERFEKPHSNGATACFLDQEAAVMILAGDGNGEFTPLLQSWLDPRARRLLHDPESGKFVAKGDRKNRKTRKTEKTFDDQ